MSSDVQDAAPTTISGAEGEGVYAPLPEIVENANITRYAASKGFSSWEELYKWSVEHPTDFWADMAGHAGHPALPPSSSTVKPWLT